MKLKSRLQAISAAGLLAAVLLTSPPSAFPAPAPELTPTLHAQNAVTAELNDLRTLLGQLAYDADQLNALVLPSPHWQTHAAQLNQIREHVNRIGDRLQVLSGMRSFAVPWQQDALDDIVPIAVEIANHTSAAITHLNENRQYLWAPHYVDHLRTIATRSGQMDELLDNRLKIVEARDKIETIQEKLSDRAS